MMRGIVTVLRNFLISLVMVTEELVCIIGGGSAKVYNAPFELKFTPKPEAAFIKLLLRCFLRW